MMQFFQNSVLGLMSLLLLISIAHGSEKKWSISEIQSRVLDRSDLLKMRIQEHQADEMKAKGSGIYPNPSALIQYGSISSAGSVGNIWDLTLSQSLPFPGKLSAQRRIQELQVELSQAHRDELRLILEQDSALAAVRNQMLLEMKNHVQERRRRFELIQTYLNSHPRVSPTQKVESTLVEVQMRQLEKSILQLEHEYQSSQIELKTILKVSEPVEIDFKWDHLPKLPIRQALQEVLFQGNFSWKRVNAEVHRAEQTHRRAKLDPLPDLTLGLNYRIERVSPPNLFYSGIVGLSLPLYDRGQYSVPSAQLRWDAEQSKKEALRIELQKELEQAYLAAESAMKLVQKFPLRIVSESEKEFAAAEQEFRKGRLHFTTFFQADAQIHEAIDTFYESRFLYLEKIYQVYFLLGQSLRWENS